MIGTLIQRRFNPASAEHNTAKAFNFVYFDGHTIYKFGRKQTISGSI